MSKLLRAIEKALTKEWNKGYEKGNHDGYQAGQDDENARIQGILIEYYAQGYKTSWQTDRTQDPEPISTAALIQLIKPKKEQE